MTEPLRQLGSSATFAEPDGQLEVIYKSGPLEVFPFKCMKHWNWRDGYLVIVSTSNGRCEIPELGIRRINVVNNSAKYAAWRDMEEAAKHVIELQHHLDQAQAKFDEKRQAWHATS